MLTLNPASAKSADNLSSGIKETGKYIGIFTRAEQLESQKGTKGVGLSFKSDDGQTADYLDLYTVNAKGDELPSAKTVNAILAVLMLRGAKVDNIEFEKWDKESKARVTFEGPGYPDLMNKKIGLLLQKELVSDQNGEDRERMIIVGVFQALTELTASEVLDKKTNPEKLAKMVESLMARPVRDSRKGGGKPQHAAGQQQYNGGPMPDDDIPFAPIPRKAIYSI
jgi:cytochrome c-type biogenesis protein CcmE